MTTIRLHNVPQEALVKHLTICHGRLEPAHIHVRDRITVSHQGVIEVLSFDQIVRCEASGNYTSFHLEQGQKIMTCHPLKHVEEKLERGPFIRVHQSHLINGNHIKRILNRVEIVLSDGSHVAIARSQKSNITNWLKSYCI